MKKIIYTLMSLFFVMQVGLVSAAGLVGNCESKTAVDSSGKTVLVGCSISDIGPVIQSGFKFVLKLAVTFISLVVFYVGIKLMSSKDKAVELSDAKKRLTNLILGITVITLVISGFYVTLLKGLGVQEKFLKIFDTFSKPLSTGNSTGNTNTNSGANVNGVNTGNTNTGVDTGNNTGSSQTSNPDPNYQEPCLFLNDGSACTTATGVAGTCSNTVCQSSNNIDPNYQEPCLFLNDGSACTTASGATGTCTNTVCQ